MKLKAVSALLFSGAVFFFSACGGGEVAEESKDACAPVEKDEAISGVYAIDTENSVINWKGDKKFVSGYGHNGTIQVQEGSVTVEAGAITGGSFVIDMNTIENIDLADEPEDQAKLVGHLKSDDFFDVEQYPTAVFTITSVDGKKVTGDLTMKDVTHSVSFNADINISEDELTAATKEFAIDRAKWNVKYGSTKFFDLVQDNIISDEIKLQIDLQASKTGVQ